MNREFEEVMGRSVPSLPLGLASNVVEGNACRVEWESLITSGAETYLIGNPPYLGSRRQTKEQKADLEGVLKKDFKSLDYISAWFFKAGGLLRSGQVTAATFVTTNSICQGEQVALLWPRILIDEVCIEFAYSSFRWTNSAKGNAGVTVAIVGLRRLGEKSKRLYLQEGVLDCPLISPYLSPGDWKYIRLRSNPLSGFPEMNFGNMPADGGNLLLSERDKDALLARNPHLSEYILPFYGAAEFLQGKRRWCLWMHGYSESAMRAIPELNEIIDQVKEVRSNSSRPKLAQIPHEFAQVTVDVSQSFLVLPKVSSERRRYVPAGYFSAGNVISDLCFAVSKAQPHIHSVLSSTMHMVWLRTVGGRLETRYRYSKDLVYNTFPFPAISKQKEEELAMCALRILEVRERYPDRTLAELYDPDKMPEDLLEAHKLNDEAVERSYRARPFESDEDRLQVLFNLYAKMTAEEADRGSLFESSKTKKKRKRHA